jgi:hypothetical protein
VRSKSDCSIWASSPYRFAAIDFAFVAPRRDRSSDHGSPKPSRVDPRVAYTEINQSFSQPTCVSCQIVGPVRAPRLSPAVTNMHFGRDASPGPTDPRVPWRAPLLAHGATLPCEHVWSRNRQQHEVGSCFLPSAWSGFGGALCAAGRRETTAMSFASLRRFRGEVAAASLKRGTGRIHPGSGQREPDAREGRS